MNELTAQPTPAAIAAAIGTLDAEQLRTLAGLRIRTSITISKLEVQR